MNHLSKVTDVITFPARTAIGAARLGISTTGSILGWVADQVAGKPPVRGTTTPVTVLPVRTEPDVDPMLATRTPPAGSTAKKTSPRKKVPASQVPLTSAPTPSMPAALASFDEPDDAQQPATATTPTQTAAKKTGGRKTPAKKTPATKAAAKKTAAKKTAAKKTAARKAPSKKAAVLAPALGISEAEVVGGDKG